jgi:methylglutaconyl-CoA hydratase
MSLDTEFRTSNWAKEHQIYHQVFENISEMDTEIQKFLEKLSVKSAEALALIKKFLGKVQNISKS